MSTTCFILDETTYDLHKYTSPACWIKPEDIPGDRTACALSITENGTTCTPAGVYYDPITVCVPTSNTLYAYGDASEVVYLKTVPAEDATVTAYIPAATGISTCATACYTAATCSVTVGACTYCAYSTGNVTI